jgi:hypothetical protein
MQSDITFTQITAKNCDLTKTFTRNANGQIESTAIAHMTEGSARVCSIPNISELGAALDMLQPNQAITCGIPTKGDTPLTTRAGVDFRPDAVARTNESFMFPYGPALYPIDVDVDGDDFRSVDDVLDALEACSPWLRQVVRVARPSSSSYVADRGLRGVHVFVSVTRGVDIPALAKRMQVEQWAAGRGYIRISKSGALLVRQLSDAMVYQPSRLMFEAKPVMQGDLVRAIPEEARFIERAPQVVGAPAKFRTAEGLLDVQALPAMRELDERRFTTAVRNAKNARRREAKTVAIDYQRQNAIASGLDPEVGERLGLMATRALGDKALPRSWTLQVVGVEKPVTVGEVLAHLDEALGRHCADPFDTYRPDLSDKHMHKAEIVRMGDKVGIWSHKMQEFFAFTDADAADLTSPLDLAAEKLCGLVEYPEPAGKKAAPFVNVMHGTELLLREIDCLPTFNVCTSSVQAEDVPPTGRLIEALSRIGCANVTPSTVEKAVTALAEMRRVDPWKDAILRLPVWDGQKRLQSVFQDVFDAEPSPILENVSCAFFAGLVMRQLKPGISAPVIPVLIGRQHTSKSRFAIEIARGLGVPLPSSIAFDDDRKMSMKAARSMICELAEMSGLSKRDADDIKRWVTDDNDVYRKPYEKEETEHPRRFMPIGTANKFELYRDETGGRRFGPVFVRKAMDPNWMTELPQILAEAKKRFCENESDYFALVTRTADEVLEYSKTAMANGEGMPVSDLDDLLPNILTNALAREGKGRVQASTIRIGLDQLVSGRRFAAQDIARWLTARGWTAGKDGRGMRYYEAPQSFLDISDNVVTLPIDNPFTKGAVA